MIGQICNLPDTATKGKGGFFTVRDSETDDGLYFVKSIDQHESLTSCYSEDYSHNIVRNVDTKKITISDNKAKIEDCMFSKYDFEGKRYPYSLKNTTLQDFIDFKLIRGKVLSTTEFKDRIHSFETELTDEFTDFNVAGIDYQSKQKDNDKPYRKANINLTGYVKKSVLNGLYNIDNTNIFIFNDKLKLVETTDGFAIEFKDFTRSKLRLKDYPVLFNVGKGLFVFISSDYTYEFLKIELENLDLMYELNNLMQSSFVIKPVEDFDFEYHSLSKIKFSDKSKDNAKNVLSIIKKNDLDENYQEYDYPDNTRYHLTGMGIFSNDEGTSSRVIIYDITNKKFVGWGAIPYKTMGASTNEHNAASNLAEDTAGLMVSLITDEVELNLFIDKYMNFFNFDDDSVEDAQYKKDRFEYEYIVGFRKTAKKIKVNDGAIAEVQTYHSLSFGSINSETGEKEPDKKEIVIRKDRFSMLLVQNIMRDVIYS
jgi:hypothetical protein